MVVLSVIAGREPRYASICSRFLVVDMQSEYAILLGKPSLKELKAVVSQPHYCMKFPTEEGAGVVRGNQKLSREFYMMSFRHKTPDPRIGVTVVDQGFDRSEQTLVMTASPCVLPMGTAIIDSRDPVVEKRGDVEEPIREIPPSQREY